MNELQVGADCCAQLHALRAVLDEALYCNNQLRTVIRLKDIELAEAYQTIQHLRNRLVLPLHPAGVMRE